ncbi:MAG: S8 family serine peptidase [Methanomicrobiales archaeon]|nr:S8 family serine peptidase [Methanomicrobiales archaeon]
MRNLGPSLNRGVCLVCVLLILWCGAVQAEEITQDYVPGQVIVRFADLDSVTAETSVVSTLNSKIGADTILSSKELGINGLQVVQIPNDSSVTDAVDFYKSSQYVSYAEPNYIMQAPSPVSDVTDKANEQKEEPAGMTIPNDPGFENQWGLYNTYNVSSGRADIHATEAWNITTGSPDVIIAVLDSGVEYNHEDLVERCVSGYDFVNMDDDPQDDYGHGTHIAGIISAATDNNLGVAGVSWKSKILPVKIIDSNGITNTALELMGITYAKDRGAKIISCSWGGYSYSEALKEAIDSSDALFICSAGNEGYDTDSIPQYPASYDCPNILSVGSTDKADHLSWFSNYGAVTIDLMAPGDEIYSTVPGTYDYKSGTSMAVGFVSGTAGLIKGVKPEFSASQIKNLILNTVDQKYWLMGKCATGGRLNAYNALYINLPLNASFTARPSSGTIPLNVQFIDQSSGSPDTWFWSFGDGQQSSLQNPVHLYMVPGSYSVSLTTSRDGISSVTEKSDYIRVKPPYQPVKQFADNKGEKYPLPTDPNDDGLYEDINGNGWLEYDDTKLLFDQILFAIKEQPLGQFDFDGSGFVGYGDVVKLYQMV